MKLNGLCLHASQTLALTALCCEIKEKLNYIRCTTNRWLGIVEHILTFGQCFDSY